MGGAVLAPRALARLISCAGVPTGGRSAGSSHPPRPALVLVSGWAMTSSIPCTGTTVLKWRGVPPWRGQAWYRCTRPRLREPQCHARDCLGAGPGGRASSASPTAGALGPRTGWAACSTAGSGCAPPRTTGVHPSRNRAHRPARARGSATFNPAGATLFDEQIAQSRVRQRSTP